MELQASVLIMDIVTSADFPTLCAIKLRKKIMIVFKIS